MESNIIYSKINGKSTRNPNTAKLTKDFLLDYYVKQRISTVQIGEMVGCNTGSVVNRLEQFGIPRRSHSRLGCKNRFTFKHADLQNKKFGLLTPVEYIKCKGWRCICDCGKEKTLRSSYLIQKGTKSCGCLNWRTGPDSARWNGYEGLSGSVFIKYKTDAQRRRSGALPFNISLKYAWDLFISQNKKCAITGTTIVLGKTTKESTASLDRINSDLGYIEGNVQWVHRTINQMKWDQPQSEFIEWCKKVANAN